MGDERIELDESGRERAEGGKRLPSWIHLFLVVLLVGLLLGVESILNWLLP